MIIKHQNPDIYVKLTAHDFWLALGADPVWLDRAELTELRHIIDQALNTSAEELGDVE